VQFYGPTAGVDWASQTHVACVVGDDGGVIDRFDICHDGIGLKEMVRRLRAAGVQRVAIERGDGPVVEVLVDAALAVFVVPSRQIKSLRGRYGSAGNKDDRFDAYVLADSVRTDGHRWRALRADHDDTRALRALCRARKDLVATRVQLLNQLRSNLELAMLGAVGLFSKSDSKITLAFLRRFPTAEKMAWLSVKRFGSWLAPVGYSGGISAARQQDGFCFGAVGLIGDRQGDLLPQVRELPRVVVDRLGEDDSVGDRDQDVSDGLCKGSVGSRGPRWIS